jgi:hypothetical protein
MDSTFYWSYPSVTDWIKLVSFSPNNVIDLYFSIKYNNTKNKDAVFNDFFIILFL